MEFDPHAGTIILGNTPATLRALLAGLPAEWTDANEGPNTWSPYVVVGHLAHVERGDWITRAKLILDQGPVRRFAPLDREAQFRESQGKSLGDLLDEFERLRSANLATLAEWKLSDEQLAFEGEHPAFGSVTLRQLLSAWVAHDLTHIVQITRVMAKQYREAVGPWREYLSVMSDR